jgi:hypothetical protein
MEEHRLKPMPTNYDQEMFNRIYDSTRNLTKSLARGIDARRFGIDQEELESWFDVKLLFVFTQYYGKPEGVLKANIINALKNYKCRIIKKAYTTKFSQNIISTEDAIIQEPVENEHGQDFYFEKLMTFMKEHLSENAYTLLDLQLNPTPYILKRINPCKDSNLQKIPDNLLLEYFDLGSSPKALKYLTNLKKEIRNAVKYAQLKLRAS